MRSSARAENYLVGRPDVGDTIKRLQAYQKEGRELEGWIRKDPHQQ